MILDLPTCTPAQLDALPRAATLVVGSGAAGLAVALHLEDAGLPVVLLESGGDPRDLDGVQVAGALNEGAVVGQTYRGLQGARARVLGGATQLWHGQCTRLHQLDMEARPWLDTSGWPLTLADLDPWYTQAERWFGLSGRGYDRTRWDEHPRLSPLPWSPENLLDDFTEYTPTPHLGSHHRQRLERSSLVTVLQNATVAAVLVEDDRATGVEVRTLDGRVERLTGADVVLAAGAIENARILMLSDPRGVGLGTGREHTGRYLQDHPVVTTLKIEPTDPTWLQDRASHLHRGHQRLWPKVRLSPAGQQREQLLDANAVFVHEYDDPDLEAARRLFGALKRRRVPQDLAADAGRALRVLVPLLRTAYRRRVRGLSAGRPASGVFLQVWLEQLPDRDSRVRLGSGTDPIGLRVAEVDWHVGEAEIRTSRQLSRWVAEDLTRNDLARVEFLPTMTDDDAWRAEVVDAYHPAGTTRMSDDPSTGVVDTDGQVHGVRGLHVAGSSTFPIAGYANPTLTIVALSLRLADRLAQHRMVQRLAS